MDAERLARVAAALAAPARAEIVTALMPEPQTRAPSWPATWVPR